MDVKETHSIDIPINRDSNHFLKHLGLWDVKRKPRPTVNPPPIDAFPIYNDEQPGAGADDHFFGFYSSARQVRSGALIILINHQSEFS